MRALDRQERRLENRLSIRAQHGDIGQRQEIFLLIELILDALVAADVGAVAGDDALAVRWVALHEVASLDTDESVLRAVRRLRG